MIQLCRLLALVQLFILINLEGRSSSHSRSDSTFSKYNQEFNLASSAEVVSNFDCSQYEIIECGIPASFTTAAGFGDPAFPNSLGISCFGSQVQGGGESLYQFQASITGLYNLYTTSTSGGPSVEFYYKSVNADPCVATGWTCMGMTSIVAPVDAINLEAGEAIWILANSQSSTTAASLNFEFNCGVPSFCEESTLLTCGIPATTFAPGLSGDPAFEVSSCSNISFKGPEQLFEFIAPEDGSYALRTLTELNVWYSVFSYKSNVLDPCSNDDWNCMEVNANPGVIGYINLQAGEGIWLLANYFLSGTIAFQSFQLDCATPFVCESIEDIACDTPIVISTPGGAGDPVFINELDEYDGGTAGSDGSKFGGREKIYRYTSDVGGTLQIRVTSVTPSSTFYYYYKSTSLDPCSNTDWTFINFASSALLLGSINIDEGESIYLLVNAADTLAGSHTFELSCTVPYACETIEEIQCGDQVIFSTPGGFGDPNFPNQLDDGCSSVSGQGGFEKIYSFIAPSTGTYQLTTLSNTFYDIGILYKIQGLGVNPCIGANWNCITTTDLANQITSFNLNEGQQLYLLMNSTTTNDILYAFKISCAIPYPCTEVTEIECGSPVTFLVPAGYGNPTYNNDIDLQCGGIFSVSKGLEKIYKFTPSVSGFYEFSVTFAQSDPCKYFLIPSNSLPCSLNNIDCLGSISSPGFLASRFLTEGETVHILVKSTDQFEEAYQDFVISCVETNPIIVNKTISKVTCYGGSNGAINVTAFGGSGVYFYDWADLSPEEDTQDRTNLIAGEYTLTVTDSEGASVQFTYVVNENPLIQVDYVVQQPSNVNTSNGQIWTFITGGTGTITYQWLDLNNNNTGLYRSNLFPGTYYVHVEDQLGCEQLVNVDLNLNNTNPINFSYVVQPTLCAGSNNGQIDITLSGGYPPYSISWSDIFQPTASPDRTNLAAGEYTVTIVDDHQSTIYQSFSITSPDALAIDLNIGFITEENGSDGFIAADINGGTLPYTLDWSHLTENENILTVENLVTGDYCLTVTDNNGCIAAACEDIFYFEIVDIAVQSLSNNLDCFESSNGSIVIEVSGGLPPYNYDWDDISGENNIKDRYNLDDGIYQITITDALGTTFEQIFEILAPLPIEIIPTSNNALSMANPNGSITLSVTGGAGPYAFNWLDIPGLNNPQNRTNLYPGEYCVVVSDQNNCIENTCITIENIDALELSIETIVTPATCNAYNDGAIELIIESGTAPFNFDWMDLDENDNVSIRTNLSEGLYTVTVSDAEGIETTLEVEVLNQINFNVEFEITNASGIDQLDGAIDVTISEGNSPYIFVWADIDFGIQTEDRENLTPGEYCVTITDELGCFETHCATVDIINNIPDLNSENYFFQIYPNPTNNTFNVSRPDNLSIDSIEIFDLTGKSIKSFYNESKNLSTDNISSGIYMIRLLSGSYVYQTKLILEK